ncbi:MAG: Hsp70 family protein [Candidatus Binatus sp.]|uniref:Hsp70 family protein n=1 Tax=Candidatus Binatus sp. TaxID=2811406 RepID=UPI002717B050|nr:Hsp70 family protein [Candidatus Binatus sp.]MDO8430971.1 Hsp70 family protein [Candidatus Binatus sp.]
MSFEVKAVGLDFGTTNSAISVVGADGAPRLARFPHAEGGAATETFRSILFFETRDEIGGAASAVSVGNDAIRRYLAASGNGRLVQSLKSFLADKTFDSTDIMGENYTLGDLIAPIISALRDAAIAQFGELPPRIVVGRPVHFASMGAADEALARSRLDIAVRRAGWTEVEFEYEPVGAAYDYALRIARDELVLIADFGGGTSDFSLLQLRPRSAAKHGAVRYEILGNDGVGIAGDAFDGRIMRHLVAPALGRGTKYRSPYGMVLPAPTWPYTRLERWHYLSFLKARATMLRFEELKRQSLEPDKIGALIHVVENDLGYFLFRAVEQSKLELSDAESAIFNFVDAPVEIEAIVGRAEFEAWIDRYLAQIAGCVDRLMLTAGLEARSIDSVFLTGGSSFVPAVRRIFVERFGADRIRMGDEFTSVARGLALRALDGAA